MLLLALLTLSLQAPPHNAVEIGMAPWTDCIRRAARAWATLRDPADVIARGAVASCSALEPAAQAAFRESLIADGLGSAMASERARVLLDTARAGLVERAIAVVLEARAGLRQQ